MPIREHSRIIDTKKSSLLLFLFTQMAERGCNNMSDEKTELALEFIKYMTSAEVQEKIFTGVQANPCNTTVDLNALA